MAAMHHGKHTVHHHHYKRGGRAEGGDVAEEEREKLLEEDLKEGRASEKYTPPVKVEKEAEAGGYGGHRHGGRAHHKKATGGPVAKAAGGPIALRRGGSVHHGAMPMHVDGKAPRHHRLDRPGRKRGGGIGADTSPFTAAARLSSPAGAHIQTKTDKEDD